jgi:hypothetical protein
VCHLKVLSLRPFVCAQAPFVWLQNDKIISPAFWVEDPIKIIVGKKSDEWPKKSQFFSSVLRRKKKH